jgi:hypothetical protein
MLLPACLGFLLAVLWMDLMFDVQVLRHRGPVPEPVLASIAAYYRRVTTEAAPMSHLIAAVMVTGLGALLAQLPAVPRGRALALLVLLGGPVLLAALRVVPNARRLGRRVDPLPVQSALARAICRDHVLCLGSVVVALVIAVTD